MGLNYYAIRNVDEAEKDTLKTLLDQERFTELKKSIPKARIHIGKYSNGWEFLFNHNNWLYYDSYESLDGFIQEHIIMDEYSRVCTSKELWEMVETQKGKLTGERYEEQWDEIHPGMSKPHYMRSGEKTDEEWFGLRFSTSTKFT